MTLLRPRPSTAQNSEYWPSSLAGVDERADLAHEVAAARLLDLDDLGALLAEQPRAERRGDARAEIEDAQPGERTGSTGPPARAGCSCFTASMPALLARLDLRRARSGVFDTNWCSMKW